MTQDTEAIIRSRLRSPRAAATAGIVFSVLLTTSVILVRYVAAISPATIDREGLESGATAATVAVTLIPFAGLALLWFTGVIRDWVGDREDKFFASLFFGSGILIIGSGGSVHNLRALNRHNATASWARAFEDWLLQSIEGGHFERLIGEDGFPPVFRTAHPTTEHFLPLVVAWSAAGCESPGERLYQGFMYGNVGLSMYQFG